MEFIRVPEHQAKEANEQAALNVDRFRRSSDVVTNKIDVWTQRNYNQMVWNRHMYNMGLRKINKMLCLNKEKLLLDGVKSAYVEYRSSEVVTNKIDVWTQKNYNQMVWNRHLYNIKDALDFRYWKRTQTLLSSESESIRLLLGVITGHCMISWT